MKFSVVVCLFLMPVVQAFAADADQATCTSDECEPIMAGYHDKTVYIRPKAKDKYAYKEAETECLGLGGTVSTAVDVRNKGYLEFAAALKFGIKFDVWVFKGPILRSDRTGVPDVNATCYALQAKQASGGGRYTNISQVDCEEQRDVICEIPRRDACGNLKPARYFNGSCYWVSTTLTSSTPLKNISDHDSECYKRGASLTSIHSDEEMRHVLNLLASQLKQDTAAGLHNSTDWQNFIAFLGIKRSKVNNTQWINYDKTPFDYGQESPWPWCTGEPDNLSQTIVRLGPFNTENASDPFATRDPRNYGCWHDADAVYGAPYAICKRSLTSKVTGSSRYFYYGPEVSPTLRPSSTTTITASTTQGAPVESVDG